MKRKMKKRKMKVVWDLEKDGLSSSLIGIFLTCRMQFKLEIVHGWRSMHEPFYFAFGQCMHWVLEHLYAWDSVPTRKDAFKQIRQYHQEWLKDRPMPSEQQLEQQERVYGLGEASMAGYLLRWAGDWPRGKYPFPMEVAYPKNMWLALEGEFEVNYEIDFFGEKRTIKLRGKRDGVFLYKGKRPWVFDTKCQSIISDADILDTLAVNMQQMLYMFCCWHETGITPAGCVLNVIRRPGHRLWKSEVQKVFYARVMEDVTKEARLSHFFHRYQLEITPADLIRWENEFLIPMLKDILTWNDGGTGTYMNPNALITKYGRAAMFEPMVHDDYSGCYQRDNVFDYHTKLV